LARFSFWGLWLVKDSALPITAPSRRLFLRHGHFADERQLAAQCHVNASTIGSVIGTDRSDQPASFVFMKAAKEHLAPAKGDADSRASTVLAFATSH
jgi:hypothetical protein